MKFASISTGILLLCFFAAVPVACRADQSNQSGNDFSSAVNLYMSAPVNSYDYQPAIDAFSKIAIEAKDKETEFRARYFLALADFCATRFDEAYKQADACRALANQLYPEDISVKTADFILSGGSKEGESNFPALKDIIFANSRIKPMMPGTNGENLLSIAETIKIMHTLTPLERMWPTPVYRNGRDKINRIRQRGNITADETLVIGMMEKNIACLKESTGSQFALTCGILALFIDKCGAAEDEIKNNMKAAICCHNLRQLGIAFHMYALDNNGSFPPLNIPAKMPNNTSGNSHWMMRLVNYLDAQWHQDASGVTYFRKDSVFMCPANSWGGDWVYEDGVMYGYWADLGGVKLATLKYPSRQIVLADTGYSNDNGYTDSGFYQLVYGPWINPRHSGFVNVLYADGHVHAEDVNWLWKADLSGTPWNSNNSYTPRNVGDYPFWLPSKQ